MTKKMKTSKYYMEFTGNEYTLCPKTEINRKKFTELLENAIKLENETKDFDEFFVTTSKQVYDMGTYEITVIFVNTATTDLILEKYECKEGYHFTK